MELPKSADIVIIGGGVIGTSIGWHLAREKPGSIVLLEKNLLGFGETSNCVGGVRQQFSTKANIELSRESVKSLETFKSDTGCEVVFNQYGYLFLASNEQELEQYRKNVALQKSLGVDAEVVSVEEIARIAGYVNRDGIVGGTFCQKDGFADPHEITQAYASLARGMGAKLLEKVEVDGMTSGREGEFRIHTNEGEISTSRVVVAAGYRTKEICAWAGLNLPIAPYRRQVFATDVFPDIPDTAPMVVDIHTGLYMRKESGGVLFAMADKNEPSSTSTVVDWDYMVKVVEQAVKVAPILEKAEVKRGWAGLYDVTPDSHAILGKTRVTNLYLAAGFSGHGLMHSPAVGRAIAETVLKGKSETVDISSLSLERFSAGKVSSEASVI